MYVVDDEVREKRTTRHEEGFLLALCVSVTGELSVAGG